jgi:cobalt/nickel transport protein
MRIPWWVWALAGCILVAGLVAPFASSLPDGLEKTIERMNLKVSEGGPASPLPDYETPGMGGKRIGVFVASAVGILVVFAATYLFGRLLSRRSRPEAPDPESAATETEAEGEP